MGYRKLAAALAAVAMAASAQPASAQIASIMNGSGEPVTLLFDGSSTALQPNRSIDIVITPRPVAARVTFPDGHSYDGKLDFSATRVSVYEADGTELWCVSIGTNMIWIDDPDECDWMINE